MSKASTPSYSERHNSFERWFQSPLGRSLLASQRQCVDDCARELTGARQVQVGISHRLPLGSSTDFSQKIVTTPHWSSSLPDGVAVCDADELPFPGDSMDLVILHHTADFSPYPHQVLREAARVLRGGGSMLLLGFNPLSLWGLRRLVSRQATGPWGGRFLMRGRMEDWLRLLDFSIESSASCFYRLPLQRTAQRRPVSRTGLGCSIRFVPVGAYYCILATKRVGSPIRRQRVWQPQKAIKIPGRTVGVSRGVKLSKMEEET